MAEIRIQMNADGGNLITHENPQKLDTFSIVGKVTKRKERVLFPRGPIEIIVRSVEPKSKNRGGRR